MRYVPLDYSNGLLYWKNCTDKSMTIAVLRFVHRKKLHPELFDLLKSYFHHWVMFPHFKIDAADRVALSTQLISASTQEDLEKWLIQAQLVGIDPL